MGLVMRRFLLATIFVLLCAPVVADEASQAVLQRVAKYVKALGNYKAEFEVVADSYKAKGEYAVSGDCYYISVDNVEVYSDGKLRYEVENSRQEVSIDNMNLESNNILDNPTRCFDFVGSDYVAEFQSRDGADVTIYLRPNNEDIEGEIYLTVEEKSGRPKKIVYILYDDKVEVNISHLTSQKDAAPKFDSRKYKDYEVIDFR